MQRRKQLYSAQVAAASSKLAWGTKRVLDYREGKSPALKVPESMGIRREMLPHGTRVVEGEWAILPV